MKDRKYCGFENYSALLNGRFGISPEMAIRLSKAFGGSAESWLIQQAQDDLWQANHRIWLRFIYHLAKMPVLAFSPNTGLAVIFL